VLGCARDGLQDRPSQLPLSSSPVFVCDSQYRMSDRCGQSDDSYAQDGSEVWLYNSGRSRFVYYFTFINDRLQRIRQVACDADNPDCPYFR